LETTLLVGISVAALVGMAIYVQRAYHGYLYNSSTAQGLQFDPKQTYATCQDLTTIQTQKIDMAKGQAALNLFPGQAAPLPGHIGRIRGVRATVTTDWDFTAKANFDAGPC